MAFVVVCCGCLLLWFMFVVFVDCCCGFLLFSIAVVICCGCLF